jgi:hypothetical protein
VGSEMCIRDRGYMPMFWVYFDPQYPAAFKAVQP